MALVAGGYRRINLTDGREPMSKSMTNVEYTTTSAVEFSEPVFGALHQSTLRSLGLLVTNVSKSVEH